MAVLAITLLSNQCLNTPNTSLRCRCPWQHKLKAMEIEMIDPISWNKPKAPGLAGRLWPLHSSTLCWHSDGSEHWQEKIHAGKCCNMVESERIRWWSWKLNYGGNAFGQEEIWNNRKARLSSDTGIFPTKNVKQKFIFKKTFKKKTKGNILHLRFPNPSSVWDRHFWGCSVAQVSFLLYMTWHKTQQLFYINAHTE